MKKALLTLTLLAIVSLKCLAQLSQFLSQSSIYSPPSPNAAALLRYANVPVDEHTGIASVVLPIDQLAGRQISVPITLSYHGAGNKVQDIASNVGLGFVLNAGGVVTRVMRGLPDESTAGYQYNGRKVYSHNIDSVYLNATINSKVDGEPDMFYFNFMGHTGKMVIDTLGHAQYLPDQGIRVISHPIHSNPDSIHNAWVLKDFSGTTYIFGADTSSRELTVVNIVGQPTSKAVTYTSSWYLAKVITPDGKETVTFNYSSGSNVSYKQYRNVTRYAIHHDVTDTRKGIFSSKVIHHEDLSAIDIDSIDVSTVIQVLSPKYLSSIQNDMGSVNFTYTSRDDLPGGQALYQITINNIDDSEGPIKTYTFNETYFLSPHPNSPTDPDSKRLRLNCVTFQGRSDETKQLFVFSYNEQSQLPPRNSNDFDHWGYYTMIDNRGTYPPINLTVDKYGNYDDGFDHRVPDSVRVKANILTKVRNVNGGYTNFFYEINTYKFDGDASIGGGLRIKTIVENDSIGQVVPIVKQYVYALDDSTSSGMIYNAKPYYIQGITNYEAGTVVQPIPSLLSYEVTNLKSPLTLIGTGADVALTIAGLSTPLGLAIDIGITILAPVFADVFQFLFHRVHHYQYDSPPFSLSSTPLNNLFDINGASVSYSQVSVVNADGGRVVDYYTSQQEYPDSLASAMLNCLARPVKTVYGNAGSYPPSTSFDFERGLLKQSKAYDNSGNLVSMTTNTYRLSNRVSSVAGQRSSVSGYATLTDGSFQVITYNVGIYKEISENIQLTQSVTQLFDQTHNGNAITSTHNYTWQPTYPTLLRSESTPRSDGKLLVNYMTYPMEYVSGTPFLDNMVSHYMLGAPIERVSTLQDGSAIYITGGLLNRYKAGGLGLPDTVFSIRAANPIPLSSFKFSNQLTGVINGTYQPYGKDNSYIAKAFYQTYDSKNNLVQSQNIGEPSSSIIWSYNKDVPIAQISNATIDRVAYTSFETNDQQYWTFTASGRDSSGLAKTGKIRYQLGSGSVSTTNTLPAGTYILSLWTQGGKPTFSGISGDVSLVNGESDNHSWNFYMDRITVSGGNHITLTGSNYLDELRLYPQGAHISTVTVTPQVGTSSTASQDDKVNTYEYDPLLRIKTVRDDQYNILKAYTYSNVPQVPCVDTPSRWKGISPVCYVDQNNVVPDTTHYKAFASNSYGNIICGFTRTPAETSYLAKINYTASFTDNTTYSSSVLLKTGDLSTLLGLPLTGKSAESVSGISIDSVINMSNDYGVTMQSYTSRQRLRDGYTEANTLSGGLGPYIAPVRSAVGCSTPLFSNHLQTGFFKNDCAPVSAGTPVSYTVAAGSYTGTTQFSADSAARAAGQAYANAHGTCGLVDTSFVGINPYCITGTADSGTPSLTAYSIAINYNQQVNMLNATLTRSSSEATHDATVTYQLQFGDGSTANYTTPMYKGQQVITFSPPLAGYGPNSVIGISITGAVYSALNRTAYADRKRLLNGVPDGYTETNSTGTYYLAPLANPGACGTWFYNTAQTGFYRNNCSTGPGTAVSYTVAAHTDSSQVSQAYADAWARVRGQSYANINGGCNISDTLVTTYAGNGQIGYINGPLLSAEFNGITTMSIDNSGNLYVVEGDYLSVIRKVSPDGLVSTLAGNPSPGYVDGTGTAARFDHIYGITTDNSGNVYVCDGFNLKIRKITPAGVVTTLAGSTTGYVDGTGSAAKFRLPDALTTGPDGSLYMTDLYNKRVRKVTTGGTVSTVAGNGTSGFLDGPVSSAEFDNMQTITTDKSGNIYLFDNGRIRKISGGNVSTLAGDGSIGFHDGTGASAKFGSITEITTDAIGNIYAADATNNCIRKITAAGVVTTITNPTFGYVNGPISNALFFYSFAIAIDASGNFYLCDYGNNVIRKITFPH
jgi:hypothetical protein